MPRRGMQRTVELCKGGELERLTAARSTSAASVTDSAVSYPFTTLEPPHANFLLAQASNQPTAVYTPHLGSASQTTTNLQGVGAGAL